MSDQTGAIVWTANYKAWVSEDKKNIVFPEAQGESYARVVNLKTTPSETLGTVKSSRIISVFKDSIMMRRRDCITTVIGITHRM
ncbi:hypothetical protein ACFODO_13635 [Acinetobacter sichuanensis]|uniref:Type II toxin-antitoxin system PemK/MazF family toxin n=1 Tax=Acinetobacter sichuanensis TaxID=2136183 RepID=A0ABV7BFD9_9GAMM|nr:hypothetical protein [Acinetobacter sichuanensis]